MRNQLAIAVLMVATLLTRGLAQSPSGGGVCTRPLTARADAEMTRFALSLDAPEDPAYIINRLHSIVGVAPLSAEGWAWFVKVGHSLVRDTALAIAREQSVRWPQCPLPRLAVADLEFNGQRVRMELRLQALRDSSPADAYFQAWIATLYSQIGNFAAAGYGFSRALALDSNVVLQHDEFWEAYQATAAIRHYLPPFKRPSGP